MDLSQLGIDAATTGVESLTASLAAVATGGGSSVDYDDLHAALGHSFLVSAGRPDGAAAGGEWAARDWNLVTAARLFGIEVRPLHPPAAAIGLGDAAEYQQHFIDSYAPLIRQALDHGHPVLAWQGWPERQAWHWGVVTSAANGGMGFAGLTPGAHEGAVTLTAPVIQAYVVEVVTRDVRPAEDRLLRAALAAADCVMSDRLPADFGVVTGSAAYDVWQQWCETGGASAVRLAAAARAVLEARRSGCRFVQGHRMASAADAETVLHAIEQQLHVVNESALVVCGLTENAPGDPRRVQETLATLQADERALGDLVREAAQ